MWHDCNLDFERAFQFLCDENPSAALDAAAAIQSAVDNLRAHPLIGRRVEGELRELVDQVTSYYNAEKLKEATAV